MIEELKKGCDLEQVNPSLLEQMEPYSESVIVMRVDGVQLDQMWIFVKSKNTNVGFGLLLSIERARC